MGEGEILSLKGAATQAGVSENTMREWVKQMSGVERNPSGGYAIPKDSLMGYLASRGQPTRGPRPGASQFIQEAQFRPQVPDAQELMVKLVGVIEAERDRLKDEVLELKKEALEARLRADQRINELEVRNTELSKNFTNLAETMKLLEETHRSGIVTPHSEFHHVSKSTAESQVLAKSKKAKKKKTTSKAKVKTVKKSKPTKKVVDRAKSKNKVAFKAKGKANSKAKKR